MPSQTEAKDILSFQRCPCLCKHFLRETCGFLRCFFWKPFLFSSPIRMHFGWRKLRYPMSLIVGVSLTRCHLSSAFLIFAVYRHGFIIETPKKSFTVYASIAEEKRRWVLVITQNAEAARQAAGLGKFLLECFLGPSYCCENTIWMNRTAMILCIWELVSECILAC